MTVNEHVVIFAVPSWGHVRSLVALACRIIQQKPDVGITILTAGDIIKKVEAEVVRYFSPGGESKNNIRIISVLEPSPDIFGIIVQTAGACMNFYQTISREERVTCLVSGKTFEPWRKPTLVISDVS
ncbi:glycosyltransferase family 1 protein [Sphaerobolus stellatus SS14]|uniref:Glycosyltransferase family 1 protein n=1 Tax=Sphaerobolus stellatus (strain SS14) TaxID=990650 RepID=A0A0C9W2X4_SPHS4|nr:glycosyltransferase family 1 protein [Sphaerobolus stellatus SS14]